ncbi:MAG: sulfatase-like hydrolase/transferase [Acidiferrobacterales bacterium]|nr:sulfatase-like hydrolase/transferase [Acidiferrobacterales bacterium]
MNIDTLALFFVICLSLLISTNSFAQDKAPNYILLIGDDMAIETLSCYQVGDNPARTPNLDNLCHSGVRFDNFWSQPVCSPTRATLLTGQYGFANQVGAPATPMQGIDWGIPDAVPATRNNPGMGGMTDNISTTTQAVETYFADDAVTFVQALKADQSNSYQTAAVGKWHLASHSNGALEHPKNVGFDHYSGSIRSGGVTTFDGWSKVIDGSKPFWQTGYATSDTVDDGIKWLSSVDQDKPWFLWVAFNAPHTPFHLAPNELLSSELKDLDPNDTTVSRKQMYDSMIEAMDTEIGRLLDSVDGAALANTYIIFMGDNGTPNQTVSAPFESGKAKGSLYQGGINVPFMVAGPGIESGQVSKSLVNSVDLFATVLELSDIPLASAKPRDKPFHSESFTAILHEDSNAQIRDFAYADIFGIAGGNLRNGKTIRNQYYKLIIDHLDESEELYNLGSDPYEKINLLATEQSDSDRHNYAQLKKAIADLVEN